MTGRELMDRGIELAKKYSEEELQSALKNAQIQGDNMERLALQYALKEKTGTKDGYAFSKEGTDKPRLVL